MNVEYPVDSTKVFPTEIVTENLLFEPAHDAGISARELYELYGSDEFGELMEYIPTEQHWSVKNSIEFLSHSKEEFQANSSVSYHVFEKETGNQGVNSIIGGSGFDVDWELKTAVFFIWFRKPYWGNGYSVERGEAFLEILFEDLHLQTVRVNTAAENEHSRAAIEEYIIENGGQFEGIGRNKKKIDDELKDLASYSLTKSEWEDNQ